MNNYREAIVALADDFLAGRINHQQFQNALPDFPWEDSEVDELVDSITHEPRVGWFLGVSEEEGKKNRLHILTYLENIRQNPNNSERQS